MDNIGSEVGQKMRSAIKAKLMELGCYVDDELPDYVMVMVANKRTRSQMEEDLQLFLATNTSVFVNWLHQVLQKLQEVTVNTNLEQKQLQDSRLKRKFSSDSIVSSKKEKKEKKDSKIKLKVKGKKSKKTSKKKEKAKKSVKHKSKNREKSKETESIRPNIPPLLMNLEKESSPSITDAFAGQILKTHAMKLGLVPSEEDEKVTVVQTTRKALNRNRFPIIDPATVTQHCEPADGDTFDIPSLSEVEKTAYILKLPRDEQIKEMNAIEAKIQGLKKKLAEQFESGSEDEDFLNIRTEAEELMGDFSEDNVTSDTTKTDQRALIKLTPSPNVDHETVFEQNSSQSLESSKPERQPVRPPTPSQTALPSIELNLPKRPLRDRLGIKDRVSSITVSMGGTVHRSVNMVNPLNVGQQQVNTSAIEDRKTSVKSRLTLREELGEQLPKSIDKDNISGLKRLSSRVTVAHDWSPPPSTPGIVGSIVRVPPRPRNNSGISGAASNLLLRAVADAHKSLVDNPAKVEAPLIKKAMVLPMRRNVNRTNILIEVPRDKVNPQSAHNTQDSNSELEIDLDTESMGDLDSDSEHKKLSDEYIPVPIRKSSKSINVRYVPTHIDEEKPDEESDVIEDTGMIAKILNRRKDSPSSQSGKVPQFVVTLDGLDPNVFLNKKLETEETNSSSESPILRNSKKNRRQSAETTNSVNIIRIIHDKDKEFKFGEKEKERGDSKEKTPECAVVKPQSKEVLDSTPEDRELKPQQEPTKERDASDSREAQPLPKKRKCSPIVFDVFNKTKQTSPSKARERKSSGDDALTVTIGSTKYEELPNASVEVRQPGQAAVHPLASSLCRMFPLCTFGSDCLFSHPPCKFGVTCVRRDCIYDHSLALAAIPALLETSGVPPIVASRVVPASNYKSISSAATPSVCKFHPHCVNAACQFYHPKMCRYGRNCLNKIECSFYHHDKSSPLTPPASALKWKSPFTV